MVGRGEEESMEPHVCPVWIGYLLVSPLRRLLEPVDRVFGDHLGPGNTVLDVGCAMGYFTLPSARRVGPGGRVVAVDLQPRMLESLGRRARRAGLADRIETRACTPDTLGLSDLVGSVDVALAIHVVHEAPDGAMLMREVHAALRPGGVFVVGEPKGHVDEAMFEETLAWGTDSGFEIIQRRDSRRGRYATFQRPVND